MYEGGCLCGALRYQADEDPADTGYCHCELCQRSTGAPVLAWASFPVESFRYAKGSPAIYPSSSWGQREFCRSCGTQICYRESEATEYVDVNIGSLDAPASCPPRCHTFTKDRLPWLRIEDDLPRYEGSSPGDEKV